MTYNDHFVSIVEGLAIGRHYVNKDAETSN